ncbi:MAG: hypothetical protein IKS98_09690 [Lachnospiraceae bacterium]|nr:hypothetical protein [Lachnospiraceae bacterium]
MLSKVCICFKKPKKAEALENAGREENADRIKAETGYVLKEYERYFKELDKVFKKA